MSWRSELDASTRARLNHPTAILRRWKKDTEPLVDKMAVPPFKEKPENPFLGAPADAEGERDAARRHSQDLRVLLDRVLREVDNLPEDLRAAIEKVLGCTRAARVLLGHALINRDCSAIGCREATCAACGCSGDLLPPPPAEKTTARED
jgi:hypothetical protein